MSRVAKAPIVVPLNAEIEIVGRLISVKGPKGLLSRTIHDAVVVHYDKNVLTFMPRTGCSNAWAQAGTTRALVNSMLIGVTEGFSKILQLIGVGYRASFKENIISLTLGFSHSIDHVLPLGITAECPSQTEINIKGADKQLVGQVAADIRAYRRPEPYKGKGVRYMNEVVRTKEAKKK